METIKSYHFHAAHRNTELEFDKCSSIHGHTYHVDIVIYNPKIAGKSTGFLFSEIDAIINPLIELMDHSFIIYEQDPLYDVLLPFGMRLFPLKFESSAENVAQYILDTLIAKGLNVIEVQLKETTSSVVVCRRKDSRLVSQVVSS